jgi:hypothetical protein
MRDLDMAATLRRLAEIEATLDARSQQLEKAIDREIAELGESLKHQVSKQLDQLPGQLGPTVAAAFDKQFETTKQAIDSLVADAGARHAELLTSVRQGLEQHAAESKASATAIGQAVTQLGAAARDASDRQMNAMLKSLAEADARSLAQAKSTEALVQAGTQSVARLSLVSALLAAAALAAAVVGIFI